MLTTEERFFAACAAYNQNDVEPVLHYLEGIESPAAKALLALSWHEFDAIGKPQASVDWLRREELLLEVLQFEPLLQVRQRCHEQITEIQRGEIPKRFRIEEGLPPERIKAGEILEERANEREMNLEGQVEEVDVGSTKEGERP